MAKKTGKGRAGGIYYCSFCDKSQHKVERLIAGPRGVYICNECVDLCNEIISGERAARVSSEKQAGEESHTPQP